MRYVYASRLTKIAACPASEAQCEGLVDSGGMAAKFGSAFHRILEVAGRDGEVEAILALPAIALTNGVDVDALSEAFLANTFDPSKGRHPEFEVRGDLYRNRTSYPDGKEGPGKIVGGIIDWRDEIAENHWHVIDYKTGNPDYQEDAERSLQILAYGVATMLEKDAEFVTVQFYFPRLGHAGWTEPYTFGKKEGAILHAAIEEAVSKANEQWDKPVAKRRYSQGEHCAFCVGAETCPARLAPVAAAYNAISIKPVLKKDGTPGKRVTTELNFRLTKDNAVDVIRSVRYAKKAVELISDKLRELVKEVGPIPTDDGEQVLDLRKTERAPTLTLQHVSEAMKTAGLGDTTQLVILHELKTLPKTPVETLSLYKNEE